MDTTSALRFGAVQLIVEQRQLLIDGRPAKLGARAFDVLLALCERRERPVSKNELFELVWPDVVVEENNLQVHISALRKLLGPQTIATIPGRGYRFMAELDGSAQAPTLVATPPSVTSAKPVAATTNLPAHAEVLYGRDDDVRAVGKLLRTHPQVSIVGSSGIGKTRLALAVANAQQEHFRDGVWWIELASLSDGGLVAEAIAGALGVRIGDGRPALETVIAFVRKQTALLILDNCEHLLDAAAECARALLRNAPELRIVVTSQEALHTPVEQVYRLASLPTAGTLDVPAAAVELFVARARAADPRLQLTAGAMSAIEEICRRLDGMPLAIELAAARVRLLGLEGLRARLDERFQVLTGGTRATLRRHQTLRAALEWSYGLLSPDEQAVFRRVGVFVGGFTLELAQDVAADEHIDRWAVLDLLGHLVDRSLVVADGNELPRYRLLETMRAFALEKLGAAGETPQLLKRHAEALLAFLSPIDEHRWKAAPAEQIRVGAELDNLRAALGWADSAAGNRTFACALIGCSSSLWMAHAQLNEGIERALAMLPLPESVAPEIEARFNLFLGNLGHMGVRRECFSASLRAAELYRSLRNTSRLVDALIFAAVIGARLGETQHVAASLAEAEALIAPDAPARQAAALAVSNAVHYLHLGQHERAIESGMRQAALYRNSGNEWGVQLAMTNVAMYECGSGRFDAAIELLHSVLAELRRMNAPYGAGTAMAMLALAHALRGDRDEALTNGRAAAPHIQRMQDVAPTLLPIALVHARHGAEDRAAGVLGYVDQSFARAGRIPFPMMVSMRDEIVQRAREALGPVEFDRQMAAGALLTEEQALNLAFDEAIGGDSRTRSPS
ncbi:MAG TPA: winged helix-turn-helix domain-containing protein [Burkholderiaceae bacterium]|nr:winged helix-turn-helix domain-containing protein [Burkholderiaceae bacterium]